MIGWFVRIFSLYRASEYVTLNSLLVNAVKAAVCTYSCVSVVGLLTFSGCVSATFLFSLAGIYIMFTMPCLKCIKEYETHICSFINLFFFAFLTTALYV